ncbi:class I SAM-dependent RNA methyltransferase [Bacteroidota bacterium]
MKELLATTLFGLENELAKELESIGAGSVRIHNRAVSFGGDKAMMYRANYHLRTGLRILKPLLSFPARSEDDIYKGIRDIEWEQYMSPRNLLAVETVLVTDRYKHSGFISQRAKDGIVDRFRDKYGKRPSVDLKNPDLKINIHLNDTHCSVSLDSSGESLHKRGYRSQPHQAPLNEVLAAGMIFLSGWTPEQPFLNPMCGSGTLSIEAGMIARGLPGGYFRNDFGFQKWKDYDPELFESIRRERYLEEQDDGQILACDIAFPAIRASQQNFASAGLLEKVSLKKTSFDSWDTGLQEGVIIMNPPYGERMEDNKLPELYKQIGDTLKQKYIGFGAWVLSGNPEALKNLGLRTGKKLTLYNGAIQCKYHYYDMYEGSRKIVDNTRGL